MHLFSKRKQSMPTRACIYYKPFTIAFAICSFAAGTLSAAQANTIDPPHVGEPQGELTLRKVMYEADQRTPAGAVWDKI